MSKVRSQRRRGTEKKGNRQLAELRKVNPGLKADLSSVRPWQECDGFNTVSITVRTPYEPAPSDPGKSCLRLPPGWGFNSKEARLRAEQGEEPCVSIGGGGTNDPKDDPVLMVFVSDINGEKRNGLDSAWVCWVLPTNSDAGNVEGAGA